MAQWCFKCPYCSKCQNIGPLDTYACDDSECHFEPIIIITTSCTTIDNKIKTTTTTTTLPEDIS